MDARALPAEDEPHGQIKAEKKRHGCADGDERVHIRSPAEKRGEAAQVKLPPRDQNRHGQHELEQGVDRRRAVHADGVGQGSAKHVRHGHIEQRHGEAEGKDDAVALLLQLALRLGDLLPLFLRGERLGADIFLAAVAELFNVLNDLRACDCALVETNGHDLRNQIDGDALDPGLAGEVFFDPGAARGAVHTGDVIGFFGHA